MASLSVTRIKTTGNALVKVLKCYSFCTNVKPTETV